MRQSPLQFVICLTVRVVNGFSLESYRSVFSSILSVFSSILRRVCSTTVRNKSISRLVGLAFISIWRIEKNAFQFLLERSKFSAVNHRSRCSSGVCTGSGACGCCGFNFGSCDSASNTACDRFRLFKGPGISRVHVLCAHLRSSRDSP